MGPLQGIRVLELAGIGPAPFGCMLLADLGAEVVRVERATGASTIDGAGRAGSDPKKYVPHRGRRSIALDLKSPAGRDTLLALVERADALVESFRPGVAERLGVGPDVCLARNPRLVYTRMTGWGQSGPLADAAGHDINYIAVAGVLDNFRRTGERPLAPLNVVGDMGGGGMLLAFGIAAALVHAGRTGRGQVVDAAMVDGAALQLATTIGMRAQGRWPGAPGSNVSDSGAPFYEVYECADGRFIAVGALEEPFWDEFVKRLGVAPDSLPDRDDPTLWPEGKRRLAEVFGTRSRDEWAAVFDGSDACVSPVLSLDEAPHHPHAVARSAFIEVAGTVQPAPAPRFSRTPAAAPTPPPPRGADTEAVLRDWGIGDLAVEGTP
ncbi:CaiB/BaiF CoA transferase family protein [Mycobacterium branderi]|uniref:Carnitine dehydratase n=1 Tax=Mycobacterium branderi TaxID=43348 RepID=A0A7I7WBM8_9MYCO|nr:CaiB/BaiF CoA-transferase family protein [Mycobacterium branderi]MCV7231622.1 CoA transferase [Mycobacterium branderi]ORA40387.1 carnitine dehydratase [Mycobacterium branderi]BBZ14894.1 CoA transferase [Mycobacterium branderi]